jgi:hypothetical protein
MGPEIALALALGGTGAQLIGQREQRRDRARILDGAMDRGMQTQGQAIQQITQEGQRLAPEQRMAEMQTAEDAAYGRTMADVGVAPTANTGGGAVSPAFEALQMRRQGEESGRMSAIARELAKMRAPGDVETEGGLRRGSMSEGLSSLFNTQRNRTNAAQMDAESVDMPLYGQLGQIAAQAGQIGMMAGGLPNAIRPAPVGTAQIRWLPGGG